MSSSETTEGSPTREQIVTQLRCFSGPWAATYEAAIDLLLSDAREIERLRAEIVKLKAMVPAWKLIQAGYPDNFTHETAP